MTVTAYYPEVYVNDLEGALEEFKQIGFKHLETVENDIMKMYILEVNGNRLAFYTSHIPECQINEGIYGMRIDVTDFDEGLKYYENQGYKPVHGPKKEGSDRIVILEDDMERRISLHGPVN